MAYDLSGMLVIGISSRALFDLEHENAIFDNEGVAAYAAYQREHENVALKPGTAFPLVKALLKLNTLIPGRQLVEVVIISRNSPDTGLRAFNSIESYKLGISRAAFTGGEAIARYLQAFKVDLFLSRDESDVQDAVNGGVAAARLYTAPTNYIAPEDQIRIAFDGDAVLFSKESENIYVEKGLDAFERHENRHRNKAMKQGPFAKLLLSLSAIQKQFTPENCPVRIAIVTARNSPSHARVIKTLRTWNVTVDEAFFLGGLTKSDVLHAFGAHMFFDDQDGHVQLASALVPSGRVPYEGGDLAAKPARRNATTK
ncbi:5'-nucleotidase [Herbaspirillum sp. RTI4]|uniref:5'-nucleotidase n=1 Tax=Herbaspirillum sp. RTI4 TaxID=3048640 RepID=UPI002AB47BA6|nr:5'-nucleotidase [Herbaspirillum sp. RTI4]MDY7576891.1 5'-nucleotidase [Herbaspirillum sp. RTI4]MEA9982502.1 5'-nucleotidase [Herbaspirillum sp. RTI4]